MAYEPTDPMTEPIPNPSSRPSWGEAFGVLRIANFRRYVASHVVLVTSLSMQRIMLAWLVLEISGNMLHVGLAVAMQYLPMLLFGLVGGVAADRWSKRQILLVCQFAYVATAIITLVVALTDTFSVPVIYLVGIVIGVIQAFQLPASQGIVGEIVSTSRIPSAISLISSAFQSGQVLGPALGGILLAQLGNHYSWAFNLLILCVSMLLLLRVSPANLIVSLQPPQTRTTVAAGIRYVRRKSEITTVLALILIVSVCVYATPVFLTAYAEIEFRIGAAGYGILNSVMAAGAIIGALLSAKRPTPTLITILMFTIALGISQVIMGVIYWLPIFCIALFVRGATSLFTTTAANSFIQIRTNVLMRGRVMSFYGMMMNGGMAFGNLIVGSLVAVFGVRPVMLVTGLLPVIAALSVWWIIRQIRR